MHTDQARKQFAYFQKAAFPLSMSDETHPLHPNNEADLLVVLTHAEPIREAIWKSGMDIERVWLFLEAYLFSKLLLPI